MNDFKAIHDRTTKKGAAAFVIALLALVALILLNLLAAQLPTDKKIADLTDEHIYSVSDATKREIVKTPAPVKIYLLSTGGDASLSDEGIHLHTFLGNLASISKKISYSIVDPMKDTAILERYEFGAELNNLSVIVESELRAQHIPFSDFFSYYIDQVGKVSENDAMYYYYYYGVTPYYCFDGEALMLSALHYTTSTEIPTIYLLTGHNEGDLNSTAPSMLSAITANVKALSLTSGVSIPADCELLIVNAPQTDLSAAEAILLSQYLASGGTILLTTTPEITKMTNLTSVTATMSLHGFEGIVADENSDYQYNPNYPHYLLPAISEHPFTEGVASVMLPITHAIDCIGGFANAPKGVTPLFTTSGSGYIVPLDAQSAAKPEGATTASLCVGAISENDAGGMLIWIPCTNLLTDTVNGMNAGNGTLFTNIVSTVCGETKAAPTAPVLPLVTKTLTVEAPTARAISLILTVLLPLSFIGFGIFRTVRRKRR